MFLKYARRLAVLAAAAVLPFAAVVPPVAADDGIDIQITSPDEFTPGEQYTVTVDVHTATPVGENGITLQIMMPPRLVVTATDSAQFTCEFRQDDPAFPGDVSCFGSSFVDTGSVDLTVMVAGGDDIPSAIDVQAQVGDTVSRTTKDVHIPGTPSGFDLQIDAPDRARAGQEFTVTVTAHTDHPLSGQQVSVGLNLNDARLVARSASAPGFDCSIRQFEELPDDSFNPGGATCTASGLADSVTLSVAVGVRPGAAVSVGLDAFMFSGNSFESQISDLVLLGSDTVTVSGRVWNDLDRDGRQDPGEPGLAHISVAGQFSFTETGADGRYTLTDMERGEIGILFVAPGRFEFTKPNVGDDQHDSDVQHTARECEDCVVGFVQMRLAASVSGVDAGLFDPKVAPPSPGTTSPPQGAPQRDLANTGVPVAALLAAGLALLAGGGALLATQRRRRAADGS